MRSKILEETKVAVPFMPGAYAPDVYINGVADGEAEAFDSINGNNFRKAVVRLAFTDHLGGSSQSLALALKCAATEDDFANAVAVKDDDGNAVVITKADSAGESVEEVEVNLDKQAGKHLFLVATVAGSGGTEYDPAVSVFSAELQFGDPIRLPVDASDAEVEGTPAED